MAKFDIAQFDFKSEAQRGLHAGVGAADLALEAVLQYVVEAQKKAQQRFEAYQKDAQKALTSAQKSVKDLELQPQALRSHASTSSTPASVSCPRTPRPAARRSRSACRPPGRRDRDLRGPGQARRDRREPAPQADRVRRGPGPGRRRAPSVTTTAKKAPAKKTTAKKAPAKKTTAKKTTTK